MNKTLRNSLVLGVVAIGGYQIYKLMTKPKAPPKAEPKSNFISYGGAKKKDPYEGLLRYDKGQNKVYKWKIDKDKSRWVMLAEIHQPKAFDWYNLNGKWIWTKWNGKLDV
jgi:hypothetical protein